MKRLLSIILSLAMLLSLSPLTFAADKDYGTNIALGKPVAYSGTITGGYHATNLTDGKPNTTAASGGVSTEIQICGYGKWMVVDLGALYELERVILHTRHDLDAAWARQGLGVAYGVQPDYSDMKSLGEKPGAGDFKSTLNVKIADAPVARYVAMYCFGNAGNVAGELEVFGSPYSGEGTGDFDDLQSLAQRNAVKLLYALGIMEGVSKTEFGVNNLITRGEAAQIICKMAGIPEPAGYRDEFLDVTADNPYAAYIQAGVDYGFISKDTHFRPDDFLLGYELLKMILCVNGHYEKPANTNIYPSKILQIAKDLELLKNSGTDGWSHVGKGSIAVIIYNAFLSNKFVHKNDRFVETDETLLEDAFGYVLKSGIVTSNPATRLDGPQEAYSANHIGIGGQSFNDLSGLGQDFIGETVYYLLDEKNGDVVTLWADDEENRTLTVKTEDIAPSSTLTSLEVYKSKESSKVIRHKIKKNAFRLRNDVADVDLTPADFLSSANPNGYVTLLDYDDDGVYDVIKVYDPDIILVDSVYNDTYSTTLSISQATGEVKYYDYDYIEVTTASGKIAAVDNFGQGSLIYVYANGPLAKIQIMPEAIEGVASTKNSEIIKLDGVSYELTKYFTDFVDGKGNTYFDLVEVGKSATFYTDLENKLVAVTNVDAQSKSQVMAIVQKFYVNPDREESLVKLYDETGTFHELTLGATVAYNGSRKTLADFTTNQFVGELVYVSIDADNNILKTITDKNVNDELEPETETDSSGKTSPVYAKGNCTVSAVYYGHAFKCTINPDTPVFTVPVDINDTDKLLMGGDYDSYYSVKKMSDVYKPRTEVSTDYAVYGYNDYMEPTAIVYKPGYDAGGSYYRPIEDPNETPPPVMIVSRVRENIDQYGELSYTISGYELSSGKSVSFTAMAGLTHAVNYAALSKGETDFPKIGIIPQNHAYLKSNRGIKLEGFMAIKDYETKYLKPILKLQEGDIIKYSMGNEAAVSQIEVIAEKSDYTGDKKPIHASGWGPDKITATVKLQRSTVDAVKDGYILFEETEGKNASIKLSAFTGSIIRIEDGKIEPFAMSLAGTVLEEGDPIIIYMTSYEHVSIVCNRDVK